MRPDLHLGRARSTSLVDVLDRVLDKGLVVAGDIRISLAEVELLTIRVRLLICSLDKAEQMGLDWWKYDRHLSPGSPLAVENAELRERLSRLEARLASGSRKQLPVEARATGAPRRPRPAKSNPSRRRAGARR